MLHFPGTGIAILQPRCFGRDDLVARENWSDFEEDATRLTATVTDSNISGSDPTLQVRARDGVNWTVELGSRVRNREAGLTPAQVMPGDRVQILGRRTHHFGEYRIKAMNLTIGDRAFDLYPDQVAIG